MAEMLVLNPRRRRRKARAKATARRRPRRRRAHARRTHNPAAHRRRRRVGARRISRRRRRRVHNPMERGTLMKGVSIAGGAIVTEVLANKLAAMLPAEWKANADVVRIGTKAAVGIALPMILRKTRILPPNIANAIAIGGAVATVLDVFNTYARPHLPFLSDYEQGALTDYEQGSLMDVPGGGTNANEGAYGGGAY